MKSILSLCLVISIFPLTFSCAAYNAPSAAREPVGSITGAVLDSRTPWRGGVIGGVSGVLVSATVADVSYRASREAAVQNRSVEYTTEDGRGVYRADPMAYDERTRCRSVRERIWVDKGLVKDQARDVCEGESSERR